MTFPSQFVGTLKSLYQTLFDHLTQNESQATIVHWIVFIYKIIPNVPNRLGKLV